MGYTPPYLEVRQIAGGYNVYAPTSTTGDDIYIYANTTDTRARLGIIGTGEIQLAHQAANYVKILDNATTYLQTSYATPDAIIQCPIDAKNIFLKTTGTGKIKLPGTATGTGDVAINGHYDILDSTGATIKLATVA